MCGLLFRAVGHLVGWRLGPGIDPARNRDDFVAIQLVALGRHGGDTGIAAANGDDQPALVAFARRDHLPTVAAFADVRGGIEAQARLLLVGPVTLRAMLGEDWFDVAQVIHRRLSTAGEWKENQCDRRKQFHDGWRNLVRCFQSS